MKLLKEENGLYAIDVTNAKWATEQINQVYHDAGVGLKDVGLKNRIRKGLPFQLQSSSEIKLIESFDVLSIKEWNESESFRAFPIIALEQIT